MLRVRLKDEVAQSILRRRVGDRTKQREASPLAVDRVLPRRKRHTASVPVAPFPYREADQLETLERPVFEMNFGFGQLARRIALVVWRDLDSHGELLCLEMRQVGCPDPSCAGVLGSIGG